MVESPYAGDIEQNMIYLWRCIKDSIERGEYPFASHGFYTKVLDDSLVPERDLGIRAGYEWMAVADAVIFYTDYGWSSGMKKARNRAKKLEKFITSRKIGRNIL